MLARMSGEPKRGQTADHVDPQLPSSRRPEPVLLVGFPKPAVLDVPLGQPVGRDWLAEHGLADAEVSASHLRFDKSRQGVVVRDVGSRNGTWLNGRLLPPNDKQLLAEGAVIRLGRTLMVYRGALLGEREPAPPLGHLVGPFGLRGVRANIEALARREPRNVLLEGETGSGKELAASAVANALGRAHAFAPVNVAGVASGVFESQLFGHVAGAFSGATQASQGVVQAHDGGVVFLDEIGELSLELQPKLLRLLENREILPVGAERPVLVDVCILAATNRHLEVMVEQGTFRRDLLARLSMARLRLPPLRDRAEDIFSIARAVAPRVRLELPPESCEVEAVERLLLERWETNVRGLLAALAQIATIDPSPGLRLWAIDEVLGARADAVGAPLMVSTVRAALEACDGNESKAARRLGVSRGKLRRFLGKSPS
ncbi:MAG TPA: FHA domain-containing protein [Polyangiaceae bacterium]|nr:FHA domain-containing protein [Polyangiaceae bacterium]